MLDYISKHNTVDGSFAYMSSPLDLDSVILKVAHDVGCDISSIVIVDSDMHQFDYYPRLVCGTLHSMENSQYKLVLKSRSVNDVKCIFNSGLRTI